MVTAMDAVGVDGALLVSPFTDVPLGRELCRSRCATSIPSRFALVKPVDPNDPKVAETIADWAKTPGTVGIRIMMTREHVE